MSKLLLSLLLLSSFAATAAYAEGRRVLEMTYENHAWGEKKNGCFIDDQRGVYLYQEEPKVVPAAKIREIDEKKYRSVLSLLSDARSGELSEPKHEMADTGIYTYRGYLYGERVIIEVDLGQEGDVRIINNSPAAEELIKLLYGVCHSSW